MARQSLLAAHASGHLASRPAAYISLAGDRPASPARCPARRAVGSELTFVPVAMQRGISRSVAASPPVVGCSLPEVGDIRRSR